MLRVKVEEGQETFVHQPQHLIWDSAGVKSTQETSQSPRWSVAQSVPLGKADISLYCKPQGSAAKFTTRSEYSRAPRPSPEGCSALGGMEQPPGWAGTWTLQQPSLGTAWHFRVTGESRAKGWIKITFLCFPFSLPRVHHS